MIGRDHLGQRAEVLRCIANAVDESLRIAELAQQGGAVPVLAATSFGCLHACSESMRRIFAKIDSRSRSFAVFEDDFRFECSRIFLHIAESLEKQSATHIHHADSIASILNRIDSSEAKIEAEFSERERALLRLVRTIAQLVDRLQTEVASEGLYDVLQTSAASLRPAGSEGT